MNRLPVLLILFAVMSAQAGTGTLTHAGVKSAGSAMAFLDVCEVAGLAPEGITERYRESARKGLTKAYWQAVDRQYQSSLREQTMYLVSKDAWLPFDVEPIACEQIAKVSEQLIKNYDDLAALAEED